MFAVYTWALVRVLSGFLLAQAWAAKVAPEQDWHMLLPADTFSCTGRLGMNREGSCRGARYDHLNSQEGPKRGYEESETEFSTSDYGL